MFNQHSKVDSNSESIDLASKVLQLTFLVVSLVVSMFLNGLVAYCLFKKRRFNASAGNQFLFSLATSNFVNSLFSLPMLIAAGAYDTWSWGVVTCQITAFMHLLLAANSNFTLAMIAYDRYQAIVKPMKYENHMSTPKSIIMLISGWIFSILFTAAPLLGWSEYAYHPSLFVCSISWKRHPTYALIFFILIVFIPAVIMFISYTYVYLAARLQRYSIASASSPSFDGDFETNDDQLLKESPIKLKHKLPWIMVTYSSPDKARRTLLILLLAYAFCWGSMLIWASTEIADKSTSALAFVCYFMHNLSTVINPIVYGLMNKQIRRWVKRLLCRRRVGRHGTGGPNRRKRTRAISLNPTSSASPSPAHSISNSVASFFDYLPGQNHKLHASSNGDLGNGAIDSYDVIQLWTRKYNPFIHKTGRKKPDREGSFSRSRITQMKRENSRSPRRRSMRQSHSAPVIHVRKDRNRSIPFEYKNGRDGTVLEGEYDPRLLSPISQGSRLSSRTEFTDMPHSCDSSNPITSDENSHDDGLFV